MKILRTFSIAGALIVMLILLASPLSVGSVEQTAHHSKTIDVNSFASTNGFSGTITAPGSVYEKQVFQVTATSSVGYSNYSATLYLGANYVKGMTPANSEHLTSKTGQFQFNVTAPSADNQTIYGDIILSATYFNTPVSTTVNFHTVVYSSVTLTAKITNTASIPYYNIPVKFILNGVPFSSQTISILAPYSSKSVNLTIASDLVNPNSVNSLNLEVLNASAFSGVPPVYKTTFYFGHPPNYNWIYYISGAVAVFMVFLVLSSGRGRGTKQPKWRNRNDKPKKLTKK
jgi:hypothetical protein